MTPQEKKCLFFWQHDWSKWKLFEKRDIKYPDGSNFGVKYFYQRICEKCGKVDFNSKEINPY